MSVSRVFFDVRHLYYLPQYLPIYHELQRRNIEALFVMYTGLDGKDMVAILKQAAQDEALPVHWVEDVEQGLTFYQQQKPQWIIFGNAYKYLDDLPKDVHTAMVNHGAGIKSAGQSVHMCRFSIRFAEGPYQLGQLQKSYPQGNYIDVGFAKLDPVFNEAQQTPRLDFNALGLSSGKPTLLYAPTFYPSSIELYPDDWPQQFSAYNLLVKPHFFTWNKAKYHAQRRKLQIWNKSENVYVASMEQYNLLPFLCTADVLISDASTALFEFAALNKPVIWCDFLKLRWTYRGIFSYRFKKRMDQDILKYADIAVHAARYDDVLPLVEQQLKNPADREPQRLAHAQLLLGKFDGKVSERIVNSLIHYVPVNTRSSTEPATA